MSDLQRIRDTHYQGMNNGDLDLAASVFADNVVTLSPQGEMRDLATFRKMGEVFAAAAPDAKLRADRTFEAGDTIITEGTYNGTHTGDLVSENGSIPASGRRFAFPYVDVMQVAHGKVISHRIYWDNLSFLGQLGALPQ